MTNREHLMKQATIDMLMEMNRKIDERDRDSGICIMSCFMSEDECDSRCRGYWCKSNFGKDGDCCMDCIADWLNEEWKG